MKKILIFCLGNSSRSQMTEGYFRYYAQGLAELYRHGCEDRGADPLTVEIMAEDNIDITDTTLQAASTLPGTKFDYLITLSKEAEKQRPRNLSARQHVHFDIPDPGSIEGTHEERCQAMRHIRETVKKHILKFIGQELSSSAMP